MKIHISNLKNTSNSILTYLQVPEDEADIITDTVIYAHLRGKGTHGIGRYPIYANKIARQLMQAKTRLKKISDTENVSILDANHGFGQVAAHHGMKLAIQKAQVRGVGVVGIRKSNSFGAAGYFVEMAAQQNMLALLFANASPAVAPTGGVRAVFGTNPIAIGFPGAPDRPPVILDMATTQAARSKVREAALNNTKIPADWALDTLGHPTTDANEALSGSMLPVGAHKGYGLSLAVDVMAGLLTGAAFGGEVKGLNHPTANSDYGHLMVVLNIEHFQSIASFQAGMAFLEAQVKAAGDPSSVFLPGEQAYLKQQKAHDVVEISEKHVQAINALCHKQGLSSILVALD